MIGFIKKKLLIVLICASFVQNVHSISWIQLGKTASKVSLNAGKAAHHLLNKTICLAQRYLPEDFSGNIALASLIPTSVAVCAGLPKTTVLLVSIGALSIYFNYHYKKNRGQSVHVSKKGHATVIAESEKAYIIRVLKNINKAPGVDSLTSGPASLT